MDTFSPNEIISNQVIFFLKQIFIQVISIASMIISYNAWWRIIRVKDCTFNGANSSKTREHTRTFKPYFPIYNNLLPIILNLIKGVKDYMYSIQTSRITLAQKTKQSHLPSKTENKKLNSSPKLIRCSNTHYMCSNKHHMRSNEH